MSIAPIVQILHLSKRFAGDGGRVGGGDHVAVDQVSLDIAAGEFFSLLGPSGCGKTTLLRAIAGFEQPDSGRILIDGRDVSNDPPHRRPVNLVFQHYALFPHLNVERNVMFGLRYQGVRGREARARVAEALDRVQMNGLQRRLPHQLSGGQRQRIALARALVLKPKVLLLDEPLSALDQKLRRDMQVELKHLQRTLGITFIFVTHDQEEALVMSDRVGVMNRGMLEQVGPAAEVFERPATEFVARFMGADNFFEREGRRFAVRPEKLRLMPTSETMPQPRAMRVRIVERIYQGLGTVCLVKTDDGARYSVYLQNSGAPAAQASADEALLCWAAEHEIPMASGGTSAVAQTRVAVGA